EKPLSEPARVVPQITAPAPVRPLNRLADIEARLRATVLELSGLTVTDDTASFTELGFDSLFLTQASQAIQSRFGIKVTFRQMLGDLSSVAALAKHLDANMPASASADSAAQQPATEQSATSAPTSNGLNTITWPAHLNRTTPAQTRFGPYKPIDKGEQGGLTTEQQTALEKLIHRYTAKTPSSKTYTAENRPHFADPRAVSGFKSLWKEMVYPIVSARSKNAKIWDIDGNEYVDITMGFGTYFFGHSPEWLTEAISDQLKTGIEIGPQSAIAGKLAKAICNLTGMDRATFCNTGSEAVMAAMRLARTITGRNRIAYFTGDYHGMFEEVLVRGSWVNGVYKAQPIAPGIPQSLVENMLVLDYADPASLEILKAHAHELAAVMIEPVQSRAPGLQPREFMHEVRAITEQSGTALIFDEVVTGFRCAPGGAQAYFGIKADMATYGKVIGGGMPIGVLTGKREYMDALDGGAWNYGDDSFPEVGVTFFAGTFVRHPLAMAAAWRVVQHLMSEGPRLQIEMEERVARFCRTLNNHFEDIGVPIRVPHFSAYAVIEHAPDLKYASLLWFFLREKGVHVWEGRPLYFTTAHRDEDLDHVIRAFCAAVAEMQSAGFLPASRYGSKPAPSGFPRFDSAPTTEAQREIFHAVQMGDEANCAFNESNIIRFTGEIDITSLKSALHDIVVRHPALRSTISEDGNTQFFHPSSPAIELIETDFSSLNANSPSALLPLSLIKRSESSMPFHLQNGPLVRFQLVRLSGQRHELIFTAHHMVCDGWSFGMILAELATAYNARMAGDLPAMLAAMSFAEYARLEQSNIGSKETIDAENYWISRFANGAPVLDLPTDRPRASVKSCRGAMEHITLESDRYERLKSASPKLGGTLFATLLSTFATLLHRITGQDDIVIGVPAAGQTRIGRDELVGHCLNFLPLRLAPSAGRPFRAFASEVKEQILEAYDYQNYTFGSLLQKINLPRDPSRVPLVSVIFNIDKNGLDQIHFDGITFDVETNPKQFVNFDLFFNLVQTDGRLVIECEYNTDLHNKSTILGWLNAFEQLIEAIITEGDATLQDLDILTPEDQRKLNEWNSTDAAIPNVNSLHSFFEEQVNRNPRAIALMDGKRRITYQELDRHANALAGNLQENGVTRDSLVGICAERNAEMLVAILAVLKAGGAYVPIDPKYPKDRIAFILSDSAAPLLLTQRSLADLLPAENGNRQIFIDDALEHSSDRLASATLPEDLAYVIYTSGSTGKPKGVAVEHRNVIALIGWTKEVYQPEELAGVFFSTSICFDVSIFEIFATFAAGGTIILAENALDLAHHPHRKSIRLLSMVPSAASALIEAGIIPKTVKTINLAGEALSENLANLVLAAVPGVKLYDLYGPSEDTVYSTFARRLPNQRATIGKPISNTKAYIVNESGKLVPPGIAGELLLGGAGLARGYLNRPELTAEKFIQHPTLGRLYRTGDRTRFMENGDIQFLGRLDFQIKLRGHRIELGEIETLLESHPAISKAIAHVNDGRLLAYVTPKEKLTESDGTSIWQDQWDLLYKSAIDQTGSEKLDRLDSVIAGWAGVENLDAQVSEWIDTTVERINQYDVRRIFEIGCGTGQILSRLAADSECYWAADISKVAIEALENNHPLPQVKLFHRPADDFSEIPDAHFDTVIINSVAQYFLDAEYLARVIGGALRILKPGGRIFLGDIQGNAILATHHAMALREHASSDIKAGELRKKIAQRLAQESELSLDPAWFDLLGTRLPSLTHTEILLRRGNISNETTIYHYDVILHFEQSPMLRQLPEATEWKNLNLEQLEAMLVEGATALYLTDIPDSRLAAPLSFMRSLKSSADDATIPAPIHTPPNAVSAEDLHALAAHTGYRAHVRWKTDGTSGLLEAVMLPLSEKSLPKWPKQIHTQSASAFANSPIPEKNSGKTLARILRKHLSDKLPEYMIPSAVVVLNAFPLMPNGKVDRKALPDAQDSDLTESSRTITTPRNEAESKLLDIWKQALGKDDIGVEDDIFALGGDSILIFQISTRASREGIPITPALVFRLRTIAAIASEQTTEGSKPQSPSIQRVNRDAYRRNL
ncbi:MAG: amino acid adenylation domain-containing protein, partial [Gloeobacteraceae cyanobacterium ES-bin-144]|nr:amino acid adenylation domain-containing protein [Verrucomicrobiales bacterium]